MNDDAPNLGAFVFIDRICKIYFLLFENYPIFVYASIDF